MRPLVCSSFDKCILLVRNAYYILLTEKSPAFTESVGIDLGLMLSQSHVSVDNSLPMPSQREEMMTLLKDPLG